MGHRDVPVAGKDQIVVDLVGEQDQIVPAGEIGHLLELLPAPDPPARIVRRTEDEHLFRSCHLRIPAIDIEPVAPGIVHHLAFHNAPTGGADGAGEGVIDRGEQHHPVARLGEGRKAQPGAVDQPVGGEDVGRVHLPCVAVFHPPADRRAVGGIVAVIAPDAFSIVAQRLAHAIGGAEIHVGHPHGNAVIGRDAVIFLHHLPFRRMGAAPLSELIEIHGVSPPWFRRKVARAPAGASPVATAAAIAYISAMSILPIIIHPDPRLKKVCAPVRGISKELRTLADNMLETMYDAPGIGLAGPQVGVMKRIFVMDCVKEENAAPQPMVLLNPEVTWVSEEMNTYEEGCLSIPDQYADVERPAEARVRWMDLDGKEHEEQFDKLWATCSQHEIDHLNGKLFIDYLKPLKRQMITRKMIKLKREKARA